uniref:Immunoglobulin V-set domain-containing protein n=1 Tax=Cyprinus carpio TaxID=7962 RepID=A0A8C2Q082_CYPCA
CSDFLNEERVVTVSISNVKEDSGIYWCGAHVITKVHLNVKKVFLCYHLYLFCKMYL